MTVSEEEQAGLRGAVATMQKQGSGIQDRVEQRNAALLLPTESGEKGYQAQFDQKDVDRVVLGYRRSASRQKPMPAPDGKLKMCSQVAPGYEIER